MKNRGPNRSRAHKNWAVKRLARPHRHAAYARGSQVISAVLSRGIR